jgi:copper homeostasis protein
MRYEVCVESAAGVRAAIDAGADRVELCADLAVGGTTPSIGLIGWAVAQAAAAPGPARLAVHVLIRPRGGDFVYSAAELDVMARDIVAARAAGADGIVLGALTASGAVDGPACERLIALARPASVTFHRAFDQAADMQAAFPEVVSLGVDRLLTSGGAATVLDGADVIAGLVRRADGHLTILPGGGVTETTAPEIVRRTGASELHFSARSSPLPLPAAIASIMAAANA